MDRAPAASRQRRLRLSLFFVVFGTFFVLSLWRSFDRKSWRLSTLLHDTSNLPSHLQTSRDRCMRLNDPAGPALDFHARSSSDRFDQRSTKPTLLRNANIWTGGHNGTEIIHGDVLLDKGIIKKVGNLTFKDIEPFGDDLAVMDVGGAWVTPGIIDMHSHIGGSSLPQLEGAAFDLGSDRGPILPWYRSIDGLNTHDESYALSISGGVTSALVLPGSGNAIGGQGFPIKLRKTTARSPTSMLIEPPYQLNGTHFAHKGPIPWRHMKQACGENPSSAYRNTRMDTIWAFREAYNKATQIKNEQDLYCSRLLEGVQGELGEFPEDLQWEALVDVLRGRVKVHTHCYEEVDLDDLVRLSNEFEFAIAALHHASETYLVPDLLKQAYKNTPGVALFASQGRYKREAYRGSEFAPRILAENGIKVIMKSDHPVMNSRYLLYEAQQAHYYGLPWNLALAAVMSTPAEIMGLEHRIGFLKEGWDADVVVWDSHPLQIGATPTNVFIDGIPQIQLPHVVRKPQWAQDVPQTPDFDEDAKKTVQYEGLPPLTPNNTFPGVVVFTNVQSFLTRVDFTIQESFTVTDNDLGVVVVKNGSVVCSGRRTACQTNVPSAAEVVDLQGGSISPGLLSYGSPLGLEAINQEASTNDGVVYDPLEGTAPQGLLPPTSVIRAVDGLQYATRDSLLAYRAGVTRAVSAPISYGFYDGLGTFFSTGATNKLENGALLQEITGLHVSLIRAGRVSSISTQIAALRRLLIKDEHDAGSSVFKDAAEGRLRLIVEAHSADIIASLILLKKEVQAAKGSQMLLTIAGATEAHLLAQELSNEGVGVIMGPRPFPLTWEQRRLVPGPPLSEESAIMKLISHNVTVGLSVDIGEIWSARNLRFDLAWIMLEAAGRISKADAIALGSSNLERLLGVEMAQGGQFDLVATTGGDLFELQSKVSAVISPLRGLVDLF